MKVSTKGRYGLRVMLELSNRYGKGPTMMSEIAECQKISRKYLHSLLVNLKKVGLVRSIRGAGGGYVLAKPPSEILASEIIQALEGPFLPVDCLQDLSLCENASQCAAREIWQEVGDAVRDVLASYTIEQIAAKQNAMLGGSMMYYI